MFIESLILSALHLALTNWLVYRKTGPLACLVCAFAPFVFCALFFGSTIALFLQVVACIVLMVVCRVQAPDRPSVFMASSFLAVMAIYGGVAWHSFSVRQDLVERFPLESMAARVPAPKPGKPLTQVAEAKAWDAFETTLAGELQEFRYSRAGQLRRLHEDTTNLFVESPGFGVGRMSSRAMRPDDLAPVPKMPVAQPDQSDAPVLSTEDLEKPYPDPKPDAFRKLHFGGLSDFVNPRDFGYVKDREHVAGFGSHQFSKLPSAEKVQVKRLELVSLLKHSQPMVYVSKELPRMKELKNAPTRGLSDFEAKGLESLHDGEDLFVRDTPQGLLMLGAVRSVAQCVKCHGGERGDLLGAFSYSLTREP